MSMALNSGRYMQVSKSAQRRWMIILTCILGLLSPFVVRANGYDFDSTVWQVDIRDANAGLYYIYLSLATFTAPTDTMHYGWMGIYTAPYNGTVGSGRFTQIGIRSENNMGVFWEFETEHSNVRCLRGHPVSFGYPLTGCRGDPNDLIGLNSNNAVSLTHDDNAHVWYVAVADGSGNGAYVATCDDGTMDGYYPGGAIYQPMQEVLEHYWGYSYASDPFDGVSFYFYAPYYGPYVWPAGSSGAYDYQNDPGCLYAGVFNIYNDPTRFYLGSGGMECNHVFYY